MTSFSRSRSAAVSGTGSALPSRLVTNVELEAILGHELPVGNAESHGVRQRYWCGPDESTADLAEEAARGALTAAGLEPHDVGLLVIATDTPEFVTPPTAAVVCGRLELPQAHALDVSAGGAEFVSALDYAWKSICLDVRIRHAVVVGVSAMSTYLDPHDARTVPVYGDGAGAVVLSASDGDGVLATTCRTMGEHSHDVGVFAGGTRTPITTAVLDAGLQTRLRVLREYPEGLPAAWGDLVRDTIAHAGAAVADVRHWLWSHPSRGAVQSAFSHCVGEHALAVAPVSRSSDVGYVGAAALPIALDEAVRHQRVNPDDLVVLTSAGAGVALGAAVLRWVTRQPA